MTAPWHAIAKAELGVKEIPGAADNPRIVEYHAATSLKASDDETPWCSAFANWCMAEAGINGSGSAAARSWLSWGDPCEPRPGCIVVLWRVAPDAPTGHVGFLDSLDGDRVWILGGNQGDKVSVAAFPVARVLAYRWPAGVP